MYSMPSRPKPIRDDSVRVAPDWKMSRTSVSAVPFQTPRASVVSPAMLPRAIGHRLVIREVDEAVLGEARMKDDVHHALQAGRVNLRRTGNRIRIEHALADDAQLSRNRPLVLVDAAATLGDEDVAAGQERDRPRLLKPSP